MRFPFIVALENSNDLGFLLEQFIPGTKCIVNPDSTHIVFLLAGKSKYVLMFYKLLSKVAPHDYTSSAKDGTWDIWGVHPLGIDSNGDGHVDQTDIEFSAKPFRLLRQQRRSSKNRAKETRSILGPWTAKTFESKVNWLSDELLYEKVPDKKDKSGNILSWKKKPNGLLRFPWVLAGDNPEGISEFDYDPTDTEIDKDSSSISFIEAYNESKKTT